MLQLTVPEGADKVLLHSCCAPCSGAIIECMLANGITPVVFFSNSNICPPAEYEIRRAELQRYCDSLGVEAVDDVYDHDAWLKSVAPGLEKAPERGPRCVKCFRFRLFRAAAWASAHDIRVVTSSLASSRWKNLDQVSAAGEWACGLVNNAFPDADPIIWWAQDWRKGGLQIRRDEIIREQSFYNQGYCGCEFSRHFESSQRKKADAEAKAKAAAEAAAAQKTPEKE